ncbi:MAG: Asp-tRNA(Asn)/Glu-tRNA(Gln) amidotransferase subunit GatC [Acidobacteria bacterium]|nr:Asp-tRNA(Asn)/Glu-tRNA(Gln) amidotransferase subunit GatC [Acidobacteriota bacterium]
MGRAAIQADEIRRIARLAQLELDDGEVARLARELSRVLDHVAQLAELELPDADECAPEAGPVRDDDPRAPLPAVRALSAAPEAGRGHFLVPRVVGR